jgi:hypothetical protein
MISTSTVDWNGQSLEDCYATMDTVLPGRTNEGKRQRILRFLILGSKIVSG